MELKRIHGRLEAQGRIGAMNLMLAKSNQDQFRFFGPKVSFSLPLLLLPAFRMIVVALVITALGSGQTPVRELVSRGVQLVSATVRIANAQSQIFWPVDLRRT